MPCILGMILCVRLLFLFQEVPRRFARTHNKQLQSYVKLHGISEGSPMHVVACRSNVQQDQTRVYFRAGWSSFMIDNNLQLGQVLVFTLTAKSTFVVKDSGSAGQLMPQVL